MSIGPATAARLRTGCDDNLCRICNRYCPERDARNQSLDLARFVQRTLTGSSVHVHAPRGYGKTTVLVALAVQVVARGSRVLWRYRIDTDRLATKDATESALTHLLGSADLGCSITYTNDTIISEPPSRGSLYVVDDAHFVLSDAEAALLSEAWTATSATDLSARIMYW
jgi:hypothetical protein